MVGRRMAVVLACAVLGGGLVACAQEVDAPGGGTGAAGPCPAGSSGEELVDCLGDSVVFVETPLATGSGVVVEGYVVTNAHVVDPYGAATAWIGGRPVDLPLAGSDVVADIALLGPLEGEVPGLVPVSGLGIHKGADVWLVGYPGEVGAEPEVTVSRGVLSRIREVPEFELTYLQTDAAIGGGQSGGALVDSTGRLVGISGLSFAERFALALDGADVAAAVERILAGRSRAYAPLPADGGTTSHDLVLAGPVDRRDLVVPVGGQGERLEIRVDDPTGLAVEVWSVDGEVLMVNEEALRYHDVHEGIDPDDYGVDPSDPDEPGLWRVDLPGDLDVVIGLALVDDVERRVSLTTSAPAVPGPAVVALPLVLGEPAEGTLDFLEPYDLFEVSLEEGDRVDLLARSPVGDLIVQVRAPGEPLIDAELFDDGGGGLYDYDSGGTYRARTSGVHQVFVMAWDPIAVPYRLLLEAG